jgi:hypothetical protein
MAAAHSKLLKGLPRRGERHPKKAREPRAATTMKANKIMAGMERPPGAMEKRALRSTDFTGR